MGTGNNPSTRTADGDVGGQSGDDRYIVTLRQYGPEGLTALLQAGGKIVRELPEVSSVAARLPGQAVDGLRHHPLIAAIEADARRYPMALWDDITEGGEIIPYGIRMVQADQLTDSGIGTRTVCIIDSGFFRAHEDLQDALVTASPDIGTGDPFLDLDGHGTHVAGTIAAIGGNGVGVRGVTQSQRLRLHIVKVFGDDGGWTYSSDLVAALTQCRNAGANVVSMSLGGPSSVAAEQTAFNNAQTAGVLSIAAAGNDGTTGVSYPGGYASVVSVAAVDADEVVADFSQKNATVEIAAPGVAVLSTVPYHEDNSLTVNATTYRGNHIEFAARSGGVAGPLVLGGLCGSINGSWSGQVVLCERGTYSFWEKVSNVQNSGGKAAIIYNNEPGNFFGTLDPNSSSIPAISLSQADGVAAAAAAGLSANVVSVVQKPTYDGYDYFDGTSMATPHVSAVAALIWSYNPSWLNTQIRTALQNTAKDKGAAGKDNSYGYGIVQAKAALDYLCQTTGSGCTAPAEPPPPDPGGACVTDTDASHFGQYAGVASGIDLESSPGSLVLESSGTVTTLDQQQPSTGCASCPTITNTQWLAQTFVPAISGRLTKVEVNLFLGSGGTAGTVIVEIRNTVSGAPGAVVLASTSLSPGSSWSTARFTSPASITSGTSYAVVLRAGSGGTYAARRTNNNSYASGAFHLSTNSGSSWSAQNSDLSFKTHVTTGTLVYATSGSFVSSNKDGSPGGHHPVEWGTIAWSGTYPPGTEVQFQVAASDALDAPFEFVGPDGTNATYFASGASLDQFNGFRYLRYRALLSTTDTGVSPVVEDVTVCYATVGDDCSGTALPVITPAPAEVCSSSAGNSASGPSGMSSYEWSISNGVITSGISGQTVTYTAGISGNVTLHLTVMDDGCLVSSELEIPIAPAPEPAITGPTAYCPGAPAITLDAGEGFTSYLWSPGGATTRTIDVTPNETTTYIVTVSNGSCSGSDTHQVTVTSSFPPVTSFSATATGTTSVLLSWTPVSGASGYEIERKSGNGSFSPLLTVTTNGHIDLTVSAGMSYLYRVRAVGSCAPSAFSAADLATTILFTDDPLAAGTVAKAIHLTQLRTAINLVRAAAGLPAASFTDASPAGLAIRAIHIQELRNALNEARTALGLSTPSYTDPVLTTGSTTVKAAHVVQLRNGVK